MRARCTFLLALLLGLSGCTKEGEPGACYRAPENTCIEYGAATAAAGKRLCAGQPWTAGKCPAPGQLGTCSKGDTPPELFYEGAPNHYTAATAKAACEHGGGTFLVFGLRPQAPARP